MKGKWWLHRAFPGSWQATMRKTLGERIGSRHLFI